MSLRYRKSVKIMPGLRLNLNKNSTSLSFGVPGARMSINTKGDVYRSFGIPGTGLYDVQRISGKSRRTAAAVSEPAPEQIEGHATTDVKVGLFAPKYEKAFHACIQKMNIADFEQYEEDYPEHSLAAKCFSTTLLVAKPETFAKGAALFDEMWKRREELAADDLYAKFSKYVDLTAHIAPGILVKSAFTMKALGLFYAEVLQAQEKFQEAYDVLETLTPDIHVQVATCEVEIQLRKFDEVIKTTEHVENVDDSTAILLVFRGIAFREQGNYVAAVEEFKLAKAVRTRDQAILNKALFERGLAYEKMGKLGLARADYEKILVTDGAYEGVAERLKALGQA